MSKKFVQLLRCQGCRRPASDINRFGRPALFSFIFSAEKVRDFLMQRSQICPYVFRFSLVRRERAVDASGRTERDTDVQADCSGGALSQQHSLVSDDIQATTGPFPQ